MAKRSKKRWIQDLKIDEGAFSQKARAAGKSTKEYAREKAHAPGRLGKQARLALVFMKISRKRKGKKRG